MTHLPPLVVIAFVFLTSACGRRDGKTGDRAPNDGDSAAVRSAREDFAAQQKTEEAAYAAMVVAADNDTRRRNAGQSNRGSSLAVDLAKSFEDFISDARREAERFHNKRMKRWKKVFQEWEEKKWAGYTPTEAMEKPSRKSFEEGQYEGRFGTLPMMAPATPPMTMARIHFLSQKLRMAIPRAAKLEERRAKEKPLESEPDPTTLPRQAELREKASQATTSEEQQAILQELIKVMNVRRSWFEEWLDLSSDFRGEWAKWEAKNWEGYTTEAIPASTVGGEKPGIPGK